LHEESLELYRQLGARRGITIALEHLAEAAARHGDSRRATSLHRESLRLARELGDKELIAWNLEGLAAMARAMGLPWPAPGQDDRAGMHAGVAPAIIVAQEPIALSGWADRAARLLAAAAALREALDAPLPPAERAAHARLRLDVRRALGEDGYARALAAGKGMGLEETIAFALEESAQI
jgi:hypothetical protein